MENNGTIAKMSNESIKEKVKKKLKEFQPKLGNIYFGHIIDTCDVLHLHDFYNEIKFYEEIDILQLLKFLSKHKLKSIFWSLLFNKSLKIVNFVDESKENIFEYLKLMDENIYKTDGNSLLHYAAKGFFIYEEGENKTSVPIIDVETFNQIMNGIIDLALNEKKIKEIIRNKNEFGFTPLKCAIENRNYKAVEYLAEWYNKFGIARDELSLVHFAAKINIKILPILFKNGWNVDELDSDERTLLFIASEKGDVALAKDLIERGANVEPGKMFKYTPFLVAATWDRANIVKLLIETNHSVIYNMEDHYRAVLAIAARYNSTNVAKFLMNETPYGNDLIRNADVYLNTPLHVVAQTGNMEIFESMINFFETAEIKNINGQTPLYIAAANGNDAIFERLLSKNALINTKDKSGETPFSIACKKGSNKLIRILLDKIDVLESIDSRRTYLEVAVKTQNIILLQYLFDKINAADIINEYNQALKYVIDNTEEIVIAYKDRLGFKKRKKVNFEDYLLIDEDHQACFKKAIETGFEDGVKYLLNSKYRDILLHRQSTSGRLFNNEIPNPRSPMQLLIEFMPKMAKLVFDQSVIKENNEIYYDFEFLEDAYYTFNPDSKPKVIDKLINNMPVDTIPQNSLEENGGKNQQSQNRLNSLKKDTDGYDQIIANHPLSLMVEHHCYDLFFHPLVEAYIDTKWSRFAKWGYYALCLFHFLVVIFLTYILYDAKGTTLIQNDQGKKDETMLMDFMMTPTSAWILTIYGIIQLILVGYKLQREFNLRNRWFEILVIILTLLVGKPICNLLTADLHWDVFIILYFCSWLNLLNYFKKHPRFGVYVLMMQDILTSFLRFAPIFILFMLPFVILFHVLMGEERDAASFFKRFVRTLVMMIGEFDYRDSIAAKATFISSLIFCLFIFFITIFFMNLLVGLAVSDISKILEKTTITRRIMQIETIHHIEISMPNYFRRKYWKSFCEKKKSLKELEKQKHYFTSARFREYFKWFGLPKSAIKDEFNDDESSQWAIALEKKYTDLERKLETGLEENRRNLADINSNIMNELKNIMETIKDPKKK